METALRKNVCIYTGAEAVAQTAARIFISAASVAIASRSRFSAALSGGSTPGLLYRTLSSTLRDRVAWQHVHLFWADERCVPKEDPESNFRSAYEDLISRLSVPEDNIHRIIGELLPEDAAQAYEANLKAHFGTNGIPRFDLIFLGLGEDGHTASLFPEAATLKETHRLAVPAYPGEGRAGRVTLTLPVINNAALAVFLVTGKKKAAIVKELLSKENPDAYPAGCIMPHNGRLIWLLDKDAASYIDAVA